MYEPKRPDRPAVSSGYSASSPDYHRMRNGKIVEPDDEDDDRIPDGWAFPLDGDRPQARRASQERERG